VATEDERRAAIDRLPLPYSTALRLRDAGIPDDLIAECIAVEPEAMPTLLTLAEAKLAASVSDAADK
jgi:hypothetical protein